MLIYSIMVSLRSYQERVINELNNSSHKNNVIVLPTGAGKTIIAGALIKSFEQPTLFLVHRGTLVRQSAKSFQDNWDLDLTFQAAGYPYDHGKNLSVGMIQTIQNRLDKFDFRYYKQIIIDEAHHSVSDTYVDLIKLYEGTDTKVTGLTATPERTDGKGLDTVGYTNLILGPSIRELQKEKALCRMRYIGLNMGINFSKIRISNGEYNPKDLEEAITQGHIIGDCIREFKERTPYQQAIAFFPTIDASLHYCKKLNENGIKAAHYDAKTSEPERIQIDRDFAKGALQVICNVDIISEGYDVPACSVVMQFAKTMSIIKFLQQNGRGMRIDTNNPDKVATSLDFVMNFERHGNPQRDQTWSLTGRVRKREGDYIEDEIQITVNRRCIFCLAIPETEEQEHCFECGKLLPPMRKAKRKDDEIKEFTGIRLEEITDDLPSGALTKEMIATKLNLCKTDEEIRQLARELGYKPGWAYYQIQARKERTSGYPQQVQSGGDQAI